jgi:hypothetical protein
VLEVGTGDDVAFYTTVAPLLGRVRHGSASSPVTTPGPTLRVARTEQLTRAQIEAVGGTGTDGGEQLAAIIGINSGTASTEVQPVGVYGAAKTAATTAIPNADALGLYGAGRATGAGATGSGIGGFLIGRRDVDTAGATALELHVYNNTTTDGTYNSLGSSRLKGVWLNCGGQADSGVGFQFGNAYGRQWEIGIGFNAQVSNGKTGGIKTASIRDDSTAATSLLVKGTHATAAIAVGDGAGRVGVGVETPAALVDIRSQATNVTTIYVKAFASQANPCLPFRIPPVSTCSRSPQEATPARG